MLAPLAIYRTKPPNDHHRRKPCGSAGQTGKPDHETQSYRNLLTTAISLATFSGGVATFGMMKLVPGAEIVVGAMGLLFEAGKLISFAMLHNRNVPRLVRGALATVVNFRWGNSLFSKCPTIKLGRLAASRFRSAACV
jgi:hypothetical protein